MGDTAKKIVGVAAAIAIPVAAPAISTSIGLSGAIGSAVGSATVGSVAGGALTGAALGATTSAITGTDVERGALMGGIGGGVGGYLNAPQAGAGGAGGAASAGGQSVGGGAPPNIRGVGPAGVGGAAPAGSGAVAGTGAQSPTAGGATAPGGGAAPGTTSVGGGAPPAVRGVGPATGGSGGFSLANAGRNFTEAIKRVPGEVADRFSDPEVLADATLRAAGSLAGQASAGQGISDEERELIEAQKRDLEILREQNQEAFRDRLEAARGILGEARYFDPQYFGLSAQQDVQMRAAQQQRESAREAALQPGRAGLSVGESRRGQLGANVAGQSAYLQSAEQARRQGLETYQAGLNALPNPSSYSTLASTQGVQNMLASAREEREQAEREAGQFFGSILGASGSSRDNEDDDRRGFIG